MAQKFGRHLGSSAAEMSEKFQSDTIIVTSNLAGCQIRKFTGCVFTRNSGNVSLPLWLSDPDMHHGTCMTHMPWCMPGSLNNHYLGSLRRGKASGIPGACVMLRSWQELHYLRTLVLQLKSCIDWLIDLTYLVIVNTHKRAKSSNKNPVKSTHTVIKADCIDI